MPESEGIMKPLARGIATACSAACAFCARLLGGWDAALGMLFLLMGLDILGGLILAAQGKSAHTPGGRMHSRALFKGVSRKAMMLVLVALATAVDGALGEAGVSRLAVISFYAANEALSTVENAALLGVPFPKGVLRALEAMRDKDNQHA